jgi:hypothetical protein
MSRKEIKRMSKRWLQVQGDPSVRRFLFEQERVPTGFDADLDAMLHRVDTLMIDHGVFHAKIGFSNGIVTAWGRSDPLRCLIYTQPELLARTVFRMHPLSPYAPEAVIPPAAVTRILAEFKRLRLQDANIYLRSGSLHLITGVVGLNFSCDGTHYLDYAEFLARAEDFFR